MTLTSKTQKGMYFPILNYIMECNEENINEFKKSTGKLIEGKVHHEDAIFSKIP